MTGLPCEACQEPMTTLPPQSDAVMMDAAAHTTYRRYRVCTTPGCEFYLLRRESYEVVAPLGLKVRVMNPLIQSLRRLNLRPRTTPPPLPTPPDKESR